MKVFTPTSDGFIIDGDPASGRVELPNVPSHGGVVRLKLVSGNVYCKFGDNTVVASASDGFFADNGAAPEFIAIPDGATHLGCFNGNLHVPVGYLC